MSPKKPEILAPAGGPEALLAAVRSGANAVYLGSKHMNARRNAENFSFEQLKEAAFYCHVRGAKLYLTLNTLFFDREQRIVETAIEEACAAGVDALIVQDFGTAAIAGQIAPEMPLHGSTQMSVHSPAGALALQKAGFKRVVLARELSRREIEGIRRETEIELEVFVHGALCMSVSGQCYLSSVLGARSGNRGLCAQPCRLPFSAYGSEGCDLSLKDLSLIGHLNEMAQMGIDSFKIEGRMKRPEYVAGAVSVCRHTLEGTCTDEERNTLKSVFSRSGFTDGYYTAKRGKAMFGTRTKQDVTAAAPVLSSLKRIYDREAQLVSCEMAFSAVRGENLSLSVRAGDKTVFCQSEEMPQEAVSRAVKSEEISARLSKSGGTPFRVTDVYTEIDEGLFIPAGSINELRRQALSELEKKLGDREPIACGKFSGNKREYYKSGEMKMRFRFRNLSQIPENADEAELIYIPIEECTAAVKILGSDRIAAELPRAMFGREEKVRSTLSDAKKAGIKIALCENIAAVCLAREAGLRVHLGQGMNITNTASLERLEKAGAESAVISFETDLYSAGKIGGSAKRGIISYGRLPLMLTRNCPAANSSICNGKRCDTCRLSDRKGIEFPVVCRFGYSEMLNSRPLYMGDRQGEIKNMDFQLLYFSTESKAEAERIIKMYKAGAKPAGEFTRGLYYKGAE